MPIGNVEYASCNVVRRVTSGLIWPVNHIPRVLVLRLISPIVGVISSTLCCFCSAGPYVFLLFHLWKYVRVNNLCPPPGQCELLFVKYEQEFSSAPVSNNSPILGRSYSGVSPKSFPLSSNKSLTVSRRQFASATLCLSPTVPHVLVLSTWGGLV